jgi:hypothetical protein
MTLDGVVEAPSGWMMFDDEMRDVIGADIAEADAILLGRRTYLQFAELWPAQGRDVPMSAFMNDTPKYVASAPSAPSGGRAPPCSRATSRKP